MKVLYYQDSIRVSTAFLQATCDFYTGISGLYRIVRGVCRMLTTGAYSPAPSW